MEQAGAGKNCGACDLVVVQVPMQSKPNKKQVMIQSP